MSQKNRKLYLNKHHELYLVEEEIPEPKVDEVLIKIEANGICGSDLHFYREGRLGNFIVDRPYVPGHEASGYIVKNGKDAIRFKEGDRVVIEPGIPCGHCEMCKIGRYNLCKEVVFFSAPPVDGTFCDYICVKEDFVFAVPDSLPFEYAALAEPVAVAVHAVNRANIRTGTTGVIVGAGPIGLLVLQAWKASGGGKAICIDIQESRLQKALEVGADEVILSKDNLKSLENLGDVVFETAGNAQTTSQLFHMAKAGGCVVQVGWPNGNVVEMNIAEMLDKELVYKGVNRYVNAFDTALLWLSEERIRGRSLITHRFSLDHAKEAFDWAIYHPEETIKIIVSN